MRAQDFSANEAKTMIVPDNNVASAKKLYQYLVRNLIDVASMVSFYEENYNKPYYDKKFDGFFKDSAGNPVKVIFDDGAKVEYDPGILYIPAATYYRYRGFLTGQRFVPDVLNALGTPMEQSVAEDLRKWFKEKWVRFGPDGKIRGDCARGSESEGKPKCLPQSKAHALGKKGRASAAARKRREDPNPERRGPARNVATKKKSNEALVREVQNKMFHEVLADRLPADIAKDDEIVRQAWEITAQKMGPVRATRLFREVPGFEHDLVTAYRAKHSVNEVADQTLSDAEAIATQIRDHMDEYYNLQRSGRKDGDTLAAINMSKRSVAALNQELQQLGYKYAPTVAGLVALKGTPFVEEGAEQCPECGGAMFSNLLLAEKKDACYNKVRSRYKVWPSAYASGALVQCRKKGAANWGNSKNEDVAEGLEDYEGIKIKFSKDSDGVAVKALSDDGNRVLASVELFFNEKGQLEPQDLWTNDRYQGQGIAKAMYDFLKNKGYTIIRSWDQTDAGKGFWDKHKGPEVNVWEQGVAEGVGLYGPFTATINTGERPQSRTKTKKFRREDDAILWAEDWLEDFPQYSFATAEVTDPDGNVVWTTDEQGVAEMDKSQPSHGRDGKVSHSTYGSRDRGGSTGQERTAKATTADEMMKHAHDVMMKSMSDADKVKKGWRNPNIKEQGVAEANPNQQVSRWHPETSTYRGSMNKIPTSTSMDVDDITARGQQVDFPTHRELARNANIENPEDVVYKNDLKKLVQQHFKSLPNNIREVLKMRFWDGMTLEQTAKSLGVSAAFVRQLEAKGFRMLAHSSRLGQVYEADQLDERCWDTHRQAGMKRKGDRMVPNCVPKESTFPKSAIGEAIAQVRR